jgi:hypothetical protein
MKTRTVLASSLLLVALVSQQPSRARAAQEVTALPDLVIRNIKSIEDYKVVAVVSNFGKAASTVCVVTLDIIDPVVHTKTLKTMELAVPPLEPGKFFIATFETAPQKARGNRLQLRVDPSKRVQESDEYNNRKLDDSTIVQPSVSTSGGFPKPGAPDLIVKSIAGTPSSKKSLRIEVANVGGVASEPCKGVLRIFSSPEISRKTQTEAKSFDVPALQPDETKWVLVEAASEFEQSDNQNRVTPLLTFMVEVDLMNVVKEYKENNNSLTLKAPEPKTPYKP